MAAVLGMLMDIGGGMLRDVLVMQIPAVLRSDLCALAALVGAAIVFGGHVLDIDMVATAVAGGLACSALRYMAIRHGLHLPYAKTREHMPKIPRVSFSTESVGCCPSC